MKLALVVRTDLEMGRGKIAAQVAHAAEPRLRNAAVTAAFKAWLREGQPKVVLRVGGEDELRQVCEDAGRTQVAAGTATCCAIGPADTAAIDAVSGSLRLL